MRKIFLLFLTIVRHNCYQAQSPNGIFTVPDWAYLCKELNIKYSWNVYKKGFIFISHIERTLKKKLEKGLLYLYYFNCVNDFYRMNTSCQRNRRQLLPPKTVWSCKSRSVRPAHATTETRKARTATHGRCLGTRHAATKGFPNPNWRLFLWRDILSSSVLGSRFLASATMTATANTRTQTVLRSISGI